MFRLLKVTGISLKPDYLEGDFVLTLKIPLLKKRYRPGDVVVFSHPRYGLMIKKVESISRDGTKISVIGTHTLSTDSRDFGPVDMDSIIGKVIWHIRSPRHKRQT